MAVRAAQPALARKPAPCYYEAMGKYDLVVALAVWTLTMGVLPARLHAEAFHSGGVGQCDGCHSMHGSRDGAPLAQTSASGLLQGADPSSICLNCHAGQGAANSPAVFSPDGSALTPGGDFYWLTKNFSWFGGASPGNSHGHNIVALDFGLVQDALRPVAPGGTYPAAVLACTSCHDPHGRSAAGTMGGALPVADSGSYGDLPPSGATLGNFRLLGGVNYNGGGQAPGFTFLHDAPIAAQNPMIRFGESDASHVDYGAGMSEWCANCHPAYYQNQQHNVFAHPAGEVLPSYILTNYNTYLRSGDFSGDSAMAYLQFVPFERGQSTASLLNPTSTQGPGASAKVMCLTCHRAHGSAFRVGGRWDFDASLLVDSHPAASDAGVLGSDVLYSYYGRNIAAEFGASQKRFCGKCHAGHGSSISCAKCHVVHGSPR